MNTEDDIAAEEPELTGKQLDQAKGRGLSLNFSFPVGNKPPAGDPRYERLLEEARRQAAKSPDGTGRAEEVIDALDLEFSDGRLKLGPNLEYVHGLVRALTGDADGAMEAFKRAGVEELQRAATTPAEKIIALLVADRWVDGLVACDQSIAGTPSADVHLLRARILLEFGCADDALEDVQQVLMLGKVVPPGDGLIGRILLKAGRTEKAIEVLEDDVRSGEAPAVAHYTLGQAYAREGRGADAAAQFGTAAQRATVTGLLDPFERPGLRALALVQAKRPEEARDEVAVASIRAPGDRSVLLARAAIEFDGGRIQAATSELEAIVEAAPWAVVSLLEELYGSSPLPGPLGALLERAREGLGRLLSQTGRASTPGDKTSRV